MSKVARILTFVLLAAFAASAIVHTAGTTNMSLKMALADTAGMDMAECTDCDFGSNDDQASQSCDTVCVISFLATITADKPLKAPVKTRTSGDSEFTFAGRTGPPEPYPPRSPILS